MALLVNISLHTLVISHPCPKIPISNLVGTRKTTMKNNKPCRRQLLCEANYNNTTSKYDQLDHGFSQLQIPFDFSTDYERKLEGVRALLVESRNKVDDPIGSLMFVDSIQRLGIDCHYDEEIHAILKQCHVQTNHKIYGFRSLHEIALSFRLLRQRGYNVSADVFNDFKGEDGDFKAELKYDMQGLMELYEATHFRFEGEDILDEAQVFSKQHLHQHLAANTTINNLDYEKWSNFVCMRFRHPIHKSITRITGVNNFLSHDLAADGGMNIGLLTELANMDLLVRKSIYQQELLQVSKWWDDLGLTKELALARNQPIKWYTWSMAINDISLSDQRVQLSKSIAFIYLIDDIFDLYGTPDELTIFTEAVGKWDYASMDTLPEYMKTPYKALLDTTNEIGRAICEKYGYDPITALKQTWKELCSAFLVEAKWFGSGEFPRAEDYLANGKVSSGVHVVLVHLFYLLDEVKVVHLDDASTLISSVATILRLWDDFGSAEDEHQNGIDGSYMECYMRDHKYNLTHTQVREHMMNLIASEWKRLNKECFYLSRLSLPFREASLNLARMVPLMYDYDDNKRLPLLEKLVSFVSSPMSTSMDNINLYTEN